MQFLLEEFFKKVYNLSDNSSLLLKFFVRVLVYLVILFIIGIAIYAIITKRYIILIVILGLTILGESAHYIRKLREKATDNNIPKDSSKKYAKESLNIKSKNKNLLKISKPKNKNLLK